MKIKQYIMIFLLFFGKMCATMISREKISCVGEEKSSSA